MQENYLNLTSQKTFIKTPRTLTRPKYYAMPKQKNVIDFDTEKFKPTIESIKVFEELNAISEEIEKCRERNSGF